LPNCQKYKQKKQPADFQQAAFLKVNEFFYSKLPLACRILSLRPPPISDIFTVNLPHNLVLNHISPILSRKN